MLPELKPDRYYTADIVFTSTPFVGEITVPVTMIIMGPELVAPEDLVVELVNDITGQVNLTWTWDWRCIPVLYDQA